MKIHEILPGDESEISAYRRHCREDDNSPVALRKHRHHRTQHHGRARLPICRREHCREQQYEHDIELRHYKNCTTSKSNNPEVIEVESYTPKLPKSSSKACEEECLISEILHNVSQEIADISPKPEAPTPPKLTTTEIIIVPDEIPLPSEPVKTPEVAEESKVDIATIKCETQQLEAKFTPLEDRKEPVKFSIKSHKTSVLDLPMPPIIDPLPSKHKKSHRHDKSKRHAHLARSDGPKTPPEPTVKFVKIKVRPAVIRTVEKVHNDFEIRTTNTFKRGKLVGKGTYGEVYKATDLQSNSPVALKYVKMEREHEGIPITTIREIILLRSLNHPNIVKLNAIVYSDNLRDFATYLSFEYMNHDLLGILHNEKYNFCEDFIFVIFKQILEGVNYCHSRNIIHRDLKCSNILLNSLGEVKVADWGLGREYFEGRPFTNKVSSLWYRAIELLLGQEKYNTSIDMWSLGELKMIQTYHTLIHRFNVSGCIFGELFRKHAIFHQCSTEIEIVQAIFKLCGHPNSKTWPDAKALPHYANFVTSQTKRNIRSVRDHFIGQIPPLALDLLDKMLCLNPTRRITAAEALQSNWITVMSLRAIQIPMELLSSGDCHEL